MFPAWISVEDEPIPQSKTVLVWLDKPMIGGHIQTAVFTPKVSIVGGSFNFEFTCILKWAHILPPDEMVPA